METVEDQVSGAVLRACVAGPCAWQCGYLRNYLRQWSAPSAGHCRVLVPRALPDGVDTGAVAIESGEQTVE